MSEETSDTQREAVLKQKGTLDLPAMGPTSLLDGIPTEDDEEMPTQTSLSSVSAFEGRKPAVLAMGSPEGDCSC